MTSISTYIAHFIPFLANADDIGVSGSIAKNGTRPTMTREIIMYKKQHIDKDKAIPNGRSRWGFFTYVKQE